ADRPESQDICFVPNGDYRNLLRDEAPEQLTPGPIVDLMGREIGQHQGLPLYTIGQRRGLGLGGGQLLYVVELDVARNALVVGPPEAILRDRFMVERLNFVSDVPPPSPFACQVQVRAHADPAPAEVTLLGDGQMEVRLQAPLKAITPGQAAVCYAGDQVIGGGRIVRTLKEARPERQAEPDDNHAVSLA
ncbi:MAG: tRNA 2-thiouridine(34) synthase MnmA, partial [Chloroflexia bacterium]|nr:tRNA 2-thiouridine(34) synthase MnmA [Chloroflexia bacterium]